MFIASSEDDLASKIELYQANLVDLNCSELYAPRMYFSHSKQKSVRRPNKK